MGSTSETGHAKNVANYEDLIAFCKGYGAAYQPSNPEIQLSSLEQQLVEARNILQEVMDKNTAFNNAINTRAVLFEVLKPFATRLVNALAANGASKKTLEDARGIQRKIQGTRAGKKAKAPDSASTSDVSQDTASIEPQDGTVLTPKQVSTSQQSYDQQVEHFARLISLLQSELTYNPNEPELQVTTLQNQLQDLRTANTLVTQTYADVSNARLQRSQLLYLDEKNLCKRAQQVKMYVKSVFGATSLQYKQISGIAFRVIK